ncbi:hypothetical protein [Polyangium sp. 6x1]|uniref:hypothetical protein n=1 Tax=Polyangium sp. 6x1 TaxID=3042689 RepID=UPI0024830802|nr:hypothetical protein [Polyangium sp. 6x1]MDI1443164.1 hypothetical protein [Polyangium sp. 6x1]
MRPDERFLRDTFREQLARLRSLRVDLRTLGARATEAHAARLAEEFVEPDRSVAFREALDGKGGAVDFEKWLRQDRLSPRETRGCLEWLAAGDEELVCVRFDRRAGFPAVTLVVRTLDETWASSWPGVYVHFAAGRALAVTVHYEVFQCELRIAVGSPYR